MAKCRRSLEIIDTVNLFFRSKERSNGHKTEMTLQLILVRPLDTNINPLTEEKKELKNDLLANMQGRVIITISRLEFLFD